MCLLLRSQLESHRLSIVTDHDSLKWIRNLEDSTSNLVHWRLRTLEFEFFVGHRASIKNQDADRLFWLEAGGAYTTDWNDDFPDVLVSVIKKGGKINFDHDRTFDILCISQRSDDTLKTVNSAIVEIAGLILATMTHMATKEAATLDISARTGFRLGILRNLPDCRIPCLVTYLGSNGIWYNKHHWTEYCRCVFQSLLRMFSTFLHLLDLSQTPKGNEEVTPLWDIICFRHIWQLTYI